MRRRHLTARPLVAAICKRCQAGKLCTLSRIQCFGITQTHIQHHPDQVNMASGQGAAISSSRDNQPKVVSNHETISKRVRGYVCPRCQLVLATQNERQTHIITCSSGPTSKGPTSFSKAWIETAEESRRRNEGAVTIDKVALPDSQPDINTNSTNTTNTSSTKTKTTPTTPLPTSHPQPTRAGEGAGNRCNSCGRTFSTNRGLHQHTRSCSKKRKESQNDRTNGGNRTKTAASRQQIQMPCTQVGLCDRAVCPMQHVEPMPSRVSASEPEENNQSQQEPATANGRATNNAAEAPTAPATSEPRWGELRPTELVQSINAIYNEIVFFKKNLFKLPSGAAGKEYIRETTRLLNMWIDNIQPFSDIALKLVLIMPALLLQKPSRKSTSKQHGEYLRKRLQQW